MKCRCNDMGLLQTKLAASHCSGWCWSGAKPLQSEVNVSLPNAGSCVGTLIKNRFGTPENVLIA